MINHFLRQMFAALTRLVLASLIVYSFVMYSPGGATHMLGILRTTKIGAMQLPENLIVETFELDKPWPMSYFAWLFDPEDTLGPLIYYDFRGKPVQPPTGVDITLGKLHIVGSGVLTGDFGTSWMIHPGRPVSRDFGTGVLQAFTLLWSLIAALMLVVVGQRWRRPPPYRVSALPTTSALVDRWYLHSRSPIDPGVFRRQIA